MTEQWLSIVEYARTFSISDMTVRRRIKTGKLRAVLKDGKYYIPVSDGQSFQTNADTDVTGAPAPQSQVVVKGHPAADRTYPTAVTTPAPVQARPAPGRESGAVAHVPSVRADDISTAPSTNYNHIPNELARSVASEQQVSVEAKALLAFCEAALKKVNDSERRQSEKFRAKFTAIESKLEQKDMTIQKLQQQVEDLQLLVKILEKK